MNRLSLFLSVALFIFSEHVTKAQKLSVTVDFNNPNTAVFINGVFVKSIEGFNTNTKGANVQFYERHEPVIVNGVSYKQQFHVVDDRSIEFVSLEELKTQYLPDSKGTEVIYMINDKIIATDIDSYKLDRNYIGGYEVIDSSVLETFKDKHVAILRIYTKNHLKLRLK